jgi:purine-nucleoside phosphorylase
MPTPHIEAQNGEIAETILLPGDPLRAKFIAEHYLTDVIQFNHVRNMLGFTGFYNGKRVSVMGTGMGMPSMGIYSYELISVYGGKNLIRIGTAGSIQENVGLKDIVIAQAASTNSSYGKQFGLDGEIAAIPDFKLLLKAVQKAEALGLKYHVGNILSSDIFYHFDKDNWKKWQKMGILCLEMEAYALFLNAVNLGASALAITTISDSLITGESLSPEARQNAFTDMATVALSLA